MAMCKRVNSHSFSLLPLNPRERLHGVDYPTPFLHWTMISLSLFGSEWVDQSEGEDRGIIHCCIVDVPCTNQCEIGNKRIKLPFSWFVVDVSFKLSPFRRVNFDPKSRKYTDRLVESIRDRSGNIPFLSEMLLYENTRSEGEDNSRLIRGAQLPLLSRCSITRYSIDSSISRRRRSLGGRGLSRSIDRDCRWCVHCSSCSSCSHYGVGGRKDGQIFRHLTKMKKTDWCTCGVHYRRQIYFVSGNILQMFETRV